MWPPRLKSEHLSWVKRPVMRDWYSLELYYDDTPVIQDIQRDLRMLIVDYPDDWESWVCYWSEKVGECCRYCAFCDAQDAYRRLAGQLERDDAKKKRDPSRMNPEARHQLEAEALRAYAVLHDLEDAGNAILEGREPVTFPLDDELPVTPGQFALLSAETAVRSSTRRAAAATAPKPTPAPAPQLSLFAEAPMA